MYSFPRPISKPLRPFRRQVHSTVSNDNGISIFTESVSIRPGIKNTFYYDWLRLNHLSVFSDSKCCVATFSDRRKMLVTSRSTSKPCYNLVLQYTFRNRAETPYDKKKNTFTRSDASGRDTRGVYREKQLIIIVSSLFRCAIMC